MRFLLLLCLLAGPLLAQPLVTIKAIEWTRVDDRRWQGRLLLSGPAPEGGAKVIFEPTFHFELPTVVMVPAGQSSYDFPLKLVDNTFMSGLTGFGQAGLGEMDYVSAYLNGQLWEGPGPRRR